MTLKKNDFVKIEFTGKTSDGDIFDSNIKESIEEAGLKVPAKPFAFALGQGMFLEGVDKFLIGKEQGKEYNLDLEAKDAFGLRDPKLMQLIPLQTFKQHNVNPIQGQMINFDGRVAKVLSVSGGRIRVDFNNPIAGKDVSYKIKVLKKIEDIKEKVKAFNEFLFRKDFKSEIKDKKLTLEVDKPLVQFVGMFKEKFKEVLDLDLEVKEVEAEKQKPASS